MQCANSCIIIIKMCTFKNPLISTIKRNAKKLKVIKTVEW